MASATIAHGSQKLESGGYSDYRIFLFWTVDTPLDAKIRWQNSKHHVENGYVILAGSFVQKLDYSLTSMGDIVPIDPQGHFLIKIPIDRVLSGETIELRLRGISSEGKVERGEIAVYLFDVRKFHFTSFGVQTGVGIQNYSQTQVPSVSQTAFVLAATADFTLINPFILSLRARGEIGSNAFAYDGDFFIRYRFSQFWPDWTLSVGAGLNFSAAMATNSTFGYEPLLGPQYLISVSRSFQSAGTLELRGEFGDTSGKFEFFNSTDLRYAISLSWEQQLFFRRTWKLSVEYETFQGTQYSALPQTFQSSDLRTLVGIEF